MLYPELHRHLRTAICGLALALPAAAQAEFTFPMQVLQASQGPEQGLVLAPSSAAYAALRSKERVHMLEVPLPDGSLVELDLERVYLNTAGIEVVVDGQLRPGGLELDDLTMWSGVVRGEQDSDVFLAFSSLGTRGWIRAEAGLFHLLAERGPAADWSQNNSRMIEELQLNGQGYALGEYCGVDELTTGPPQTPPGVEAQPERGTFGSERIAGSAQTLNCKIAVETDWGFYQEFGNLVVAQIYTASLFGAISDQYNAQIDTVFEIVYLGFYTTPFDPWISPESGDVGDLLNEFRNAWNGGNIPNGANLAHIISGIGLGGGVAYGGVICSQNWGFGASSGLNGNTPFPVSQSPLNWDFVVVAHEIGHNFGTGHTHNYCPPLDECAPAEYFGACQSNQVCSGGTIMSYCHLCSGGVSNIAPSFHPTVTGVMRNEAENSCMQPACFPELVNYCTATPNSTGAPASISMTGSGSVAANDNVLVSSPVPFDTGLFIYSLDPDSLPVGNGNLCIGATTLGFFVRLPGLLSDPLGFSSYNLDLNNPPVPEGQVTPGTTWYFQHWYRDHPAGGAEVNFSDGLSVTFCP